MSFGLSVACGVAAAYAIRQNLKSLSKITGELACLSDECSRLEKTLETIIAIRTELDHSWHRKGRWKEGSILDDGLADAQKRLHDLQTFIDCISKKAQEGNKGDHWQWIRKKNNVDRLRAELRSIRHDLTISCSNASPGSFSEELSLIQYMGKEAIQSTQQQGATSSLQCAKNDHRCASPEIWSQLYQEYQQAEWMSAYCQRPRVQAIQATNNSDSETCPIVQESSSFWPGVLPCLCNGQSLPSSLTTTLLLVRIYSSIRTCYILVVLGMVSIAGSLALALWRTIKNNDIQGGFSIAQYVLAVGALIIGCVLVIHSRTCSCWSSPPSTCGDGTPPEGRLIELQQSGYSESSTCPTA